MYFVQEGLLPLTRHILHNLGIVKHLWLLRGQNDRDSGQTKVYVQSDSLTSFVAATYYTNIQTITGTNANPFFYLNDGISKAYELGAPYKSATITILLLEGSGGNSMNHYLRPIKTTERQYIPANYDYTQTTSIII